MYTLSKCCDNTREQKEGLLLAKKSFSHFIPLVVDGRPPLLASSASCCGRCTGVNKWHLLRSTNLQCKQDGTT